ncbi:hypothetical protein O181_043852 [Austropuccinia psidii MF-1]|uniref:Uncharacterized protein n=1 Tax=Austropuccinia psidii MF-1 TaxID=1389203 RepID=A0A9Q3DQN9_9BASI|nr:hypothetical protein [Austropuccinia psidii MF-1]
MVITKGWNPNRKLKLLKEMADRIRENQGIIQAIEEQMNQTEYTMIPSGSQGVDQPDSPVSSPNSGTSRKVTKSHPSSHPRYFTGEDRDNKGKQDFLQPEVERGRPHDPEVVVLG